MRWVWTVSVLMFMMTSARAQTPDPLAYQGLPIAGVALVAPNGGLPEESLEPLLRSKQGDALNVALLRADLTTLFRVGEFEAAEVDVQDWFTWDDEGEVQPAVLISFQVYAAPRITKVRVQGNRGLKRRDVLEIASLPLDEVFHPMLDAPRAAERVRALYARSGYPNAAVEVDVSFLDERRVELEAWIRVSEGPPQTINSVTFVGQLPVPERRLRRWARREGLQAGKPASIDTISVAQRGIRKSLGSMERGWFTPYRGWVDARVTSIPAALDDGALAVSFVVDPGPQLQLDVSGLGLRGRSKAALALGIDERLRVTRGFQQSAPKKMSDFMMDQGFLDAIATVEVEESQATRTIRVDIEKGPRYRVRKLVFDGNTSATDRELGAVMFDATLLQVRYYSPTKTEKGQRRVADLYAARGFQDAVVTVAPPEINIAKAPLRKPSRRARLVSMQVGLTEGMVTELSELRLDFPTTGAVDHSAGVDVDDLDRRAAALVGQPYSLRALDGLAQTFADLYQASGYLDADVRVHNRGVEDGEARASFEFSPGDRVLLRSVILIGERITRRKFIHRELDLTLGEPLTSTVLDRVRERMYDLGIFRSVVPEVLGDGYARDLLVVMNERPLWAFELGGGLSTDQGIRAFGRITRRNLWGLAHSLDAYGQVGLDWRSQSVSDWVPDFLTPEWRAGVSYTAPRFPTRIQSFVVDVLLQERLQEQTYRIARSSISLGLETVFGRLTLRATLRGEARQLAQIEEGALLPGEPWREMLDRRADLPTLWRMHQAISALLLYDARNDPVTPTSGIVASMLAEYAPGLNLGFDTPTQPFVKTEARFNAWIPLGPVTLRLSGEAGHSEPIGAGVIPLEDRYRLGGTGSLRGYRRESVGPRNLTDRLSTSWPGYLGPLVGYALRDDPQAWVPTGGDTQALGIMELQLPFPAFGLERWDGWSASVFADVGNVWLLSAKSIPSSDTDEITDIFDHPVRFGVGTGIRVATPFGPIQLDFALNPVALFAARGGPMRNLLADQWGEPGWRLHATLGTL